MSPENEFLIRTLWYHYTMPKNNHGIKYRTLPKKQKNRNNLRFLPNNAYPQYKKEGKNNHDETWNRTLQTHTRVSI